MKIWALSDPHLSFGSDKPMDVFGGNWENYVQKIEKNWKKRVKKDDIVLRFCKYIWLNERQLKSLTCFCIQSIEECMFL